MDYVQLSDDLKRLIARRVADGHAASKADFVAEAVLLYADHLASEADVAAMVQRADADMAAGRYVTVSTPQESEAVQQRMVERLHANLAKAAAKD